MRRFKNAIRGFENWSRHVAIQPLMINHLVRDGVSLWARAIDLAIECLMAVAREHARQIARCC